MKRFFLVFSIFLFHGMITAHEECKPCIFVTIPKSGTHLLKKVLKYLPVNLDGNSRTMLLLREKHNWYYFPPVCNIPVAKFLKMFPDFENQSAVLHFNFSHLLRPFGAQHQEYAKIINIRDLRDNCVALTHALNNQLTNLLGKQATFSDKLLFVIRGFPGSDYEKQVWNIKRQSEQALKWYRNPNVTIVRFENLCGPKGGGTFEKQCEDILKIANALNVHLSEEDLCEVANSIWGPSSTFRKGVIGEWKKYFKPIHKKAFKNHLGRYLIEFGYENDDNW